MCLRRALGAVAVLAVALTVACGPEPAAEKDPASAETTSRAPGASGPRAPGGPSTERAEPAVTEVYTVPNPGRRTGPVTIADMLVAGTETIPPEVIERVRRLEDVVAVTTISLVNVPIENQGYNLAAVDPAKLPHLRGGDERRLRRPVAAGGGRRGGGLAEAEGQAAHRRAPVPGSARCRWRPR